MNQKEITAKDGLHRLYALPAFVPRVFTDPSEHGFIGTHLIERSIAILASELHGEFLDVGCGTQPYLPYFEHIKKKTACDFDATRGNVDFACPADKVAFT